MRPPHRFLALLALLILPALLMTLLPQAAHAQQQDAPDLITGAVLSPQDQPVANARVSLLAAGRSEPLAESMTQPNGHYALTYTGAIPDQLTVQIEREHFRPATAVLAPEAIQHLRAGQSVAMPVTVLVRRVTPSLFIAAIAFLGMLVLIGFGRLHNTLAALFAFAVILAVSYFGGLLSEGLVVFDFQGALSYVDWNVIFLILGMMIIIAVIERTGLFQWLAFNAYRLSRGRMWLLAAILMFVTSVASAALDNVTTMLLMTPITVQIALALDIEPLALLMPEVLASNVGGITTLIGTPTNILIGSYARLSFNDFLTNLTPGVMLAGVGLMVYCELAFRRELHASGERAISPALLERLEERGQITEPDHLKKAGVVGLAMLALFVLGERIELIPAVTALMGATALLVWIRPDIDEMIEAVDWTTLVFFLALFMMVGAIQEVGLISFIADGVQRLVGANLLAALLVVVWFSALASTVIPNIPFTAAMLPVIRQLTAVIPGAQSNVLYYSLSVGSAMGGNGSLIGASANMVAAGIAERAGYPISYAYFFRKGFPALVTTVSLAMIWLVVHFVVSSPAVP